MLQEPNVTQASHLGIASRDIPDHGDLWMMFLSIYLVRVQTRTELVGQTPIRELNDQINRGFIAFFIARDSCRINNKQE
jgi:hypothetical protein